MGKHYKENLHALTFDVEAWFHAHNLAIPESQWVGLPHRLDGPIDTILKLLDTHQTKATFFVLGWIADRYPALIQRIHHAGHEIASHGFGHESVLTLTRGNFRDDVKKSIDILSSITGKPVLGYRAPRYSVVRETLWALDELTAQGITYDSSIVPVCAPHKQYGIAGTPLEPHRLKNGILEFPLPTISIFGKRLPAAAGAYLRHFPMSLTHRAFRQYQNEGNPVVVNIHPWELDPGQPIVPTTWRNRLAHYRGLSSTARKLETLLRAYRFRTLSEHCAKADLKQASAPRNGLESRKTESAIPAC